MAIIPGPEKYKTFATTANFLALDMHYSTALNTSPLCRYYTRTFLLIT